MKGSWLYSDNNWLKKEPGTFFTYSNVNFGLIGTLIEKLSGVRFDKFLKKNVLEPLGIEGSFNIDDIEDIDNVAALYRENVAQVDNFKGVRPSPRDYSKY